MTFLPRLLTFTFISVFLLLPSSPAISQGVNFADPTVFRTGPFTDFGQLISVLVANAYVIAGVIFLVLLVLNGLGFIFNSGNKNPQAIQHMQQYLLWSFIGIIVIIASYWLVEIIEIATGLQIL